MMLSVLSNVNPAFSAQLNVWLARASRYTSLVTLLLVALLTWLLAQCLWAIAAWVSPTPPQTIQPVNSSSSWVAPPAGLDSVANYHLFGRADELAPPPPETSVGSIAGLVLKGVLLSPFNRGSRAIMAVNGAPEQPYAVGETLSDGVELYGIDRQYVVAIDAQCRNAIA